MQVQTVPKTQVAEGAPGGYRAALGVASPRPGPNYILVKPRVSPSDVKILVSALGRASGTGMTFHGAHYIRSLRKPGAVGCPGVDILTSTWTAASSLRRKAALRSEKDHS